MPQPFAHDDDRADRDVAAVRRGIDLFNAGELDPLFDDVFDPEVDYRGEPQIGALSGTASEPHGSAAVRKAWDAFFTMFDEVKLSGVELVHDGPGRVSGHAHMVARGGTSQVPIDAVFHFNWVLAGDRWRFMAVKLDHDAAQQARHDWERGTRA